MKSKTKTKKKPKKKVVVKKYKTTRTIRGVKRKVEISIGKDKKESIKMIKPMDVGRKKEKRIPLPKEKAKEKHSTRSKKSRKLDESKTNKKKITDTRWKKNPGKFDYPGVDTKKEKLSDRRTELAKERKKRKEIKDKKFRESKEGKRLENVSKYSEKLLSAKKENKSKKAKDLEAKDLIKKSEKLIAKNKKSKNPNGFWIKDLKRMVKLAKKGNPRELKKHFKFTEEKIKREEKGLPPERPKSFPQVKKKDPKKSQKQYEAKKKDVLKKKETPKRRQRPKSQNQLEEEKKIENAKSRKTIQGYERDLVDINQDISKLSRDKAFELLDKLSYESSAMRDLSNDEYKTKREGNWQDYRRREEVLPEFEQKVYELTSKPFKSKQKDKYFEKSKKAKEPYIDPEQLKRYNRDKLKRGLHPNPPKKYASKEEFLKEQKKRNASIKKRNELRKKRQKEQEEKNQRDKKFDKSLTDESNRLNRRLEKITLDPSTLSKEENQYFEDSQKDIMNYAKTYTRTYNALMQVLRLSNYDMKDGSVLSAIKNHKQSHKDYVFIISEFEKWIHKIKSKPEPIKEKKFKPKYYAIWGSSRTPKFQPNGDEILRNPSIYTKGSGYSSLKKMWRYPGNLTADQVRNSIRKNPKANIVIDNGKQVQNVIIDTSSKFNIALYEFGKKHGSADTVIIIATPKAHYNYKPYERVIRKRVQPGIESMKKFSVNQIWDEGIYYVKSFLLKPGNKGVYELGRETAKLKFK